MNHKLASRLILRFSLSIDVARFDEKCGHSLYAIDQCKRFKIKKNIYIYTYMYLWHSSFCLYPVKVCSRFYTFARRFNFPQIFEISKRGKIFFEDGAPEYVIDGLMAKFNRRSRVRWKSTHLVYVQIDASLVRDNMYSLRAEVEEKKKNKSC